MLESFGAYELIARIGMGGMAEVFLARRREAAGFVKDVVIKRILPAYSQDHDFVQMFHDEARLAATLRHANIVQVTGFGEVRGQWFIELELIEGADLARLIRYSRAAKKPMGANRAVQVAMAAARGLAYAHDRVDGGQRLEIVHRDVSPANIMVSVHGDVKVMDFGIAKALARATKTVNGMVKGKQAYMAPEHALGMAEQRSDIFELGICLWEMVADKRLYQADSQFEYMEMTRKADIPEIGKLASDCPPELAQVVHRALQRDVALRYQTMREFERDLNQVLFKMGGAIASSLEEWVVDVLPPEDLRLLQGELPEPPSMPAADGSTSLPSVSVGAETAALSSAMPAAATSATKPTEYALQPKPDLDKTRSDPRLALSPSDRPTQVSDIMTAPEKPRSRRNKVIAMSGLGAVVVLVGGIASALRPGHVLEPEAPGPSATTAVSLPPPTPPPPASMPAETAVAVPENKPEPKTEEVPRPLVREAKNREKDKAAKTLASKQMKLPLMAAVPAPSVPSASSAAKPGFASWLHCPSNTKIFEGKRLLGVVTDVNRNHFPVPSGVHHFELVFSDGVRRKLDPTDIEADETNIIECN